MTAARNKWKLLACLNCHERWNETQLNSRICRRCAGNPWASSVGQPERNGDFLGHQTPRTNATNFMHGLGFCNENKALPLIMQMYLGVNHTITIPRCPINSAKDLLISASTLR